MDDISLAEDAADCHNLLTIEAMDGKGEERGLHVSASEIHSLAHAVNAPLRGGLEVVRLALTEM
jgi:hypothetical protein